MIVNINDLRSLYEFAEEIGFPVPTVWQWVKKKKIKPLRIGGRWYFLTGQALPGFVKKDKRRKPV